MQVVVAVVAVVMVVREGVERGEGAKEGVTVEGEIREAVATEAVGWVEVAMEEVGGMGEAMGIQCFARRKESYNCILRQYIDYHHIVEDPMIDNKYSHLSMFSVSVIYYQIYHTHQPRSRHYRSYFHRLVLLGVYIVVRRLRLQGRSTVWR